MSGCDRNGGPSTRRLDVYCRPACIADLDRIVEIVARALVLLRAGCNFQWGDDYPVRDHFLPGVEKDQLGVVLDNEEIVGVAALTEDQGEDYKQLWDITENAIVPHRLAVDPEAQGRGYAKALFEQAEVLARERSYYRVVGDTNSQNKRAQKLFASQGFKLVGQLTLAGRKGLEFLGYEKDFRHEKAEKASQTS